MTFEILKKSTKSPGFILQAVSRMRKVFDQKLRSFHDFISFMRASPESAEKFLHNCLRSSMVSLLMCRKSVSTGQLMKTSVLSSPLACPGPLARIGIATTAIPFTRSRFSIRAASSISVF
ncbi:hypothetical protein [Faecalibaculum rodentium]|uniref:hypothetical protein n=1 Tax=Faecalibaculum rodentium TaxID=1702221 RepID=UPI001F594156|nr:hypothetical protein [Faecalibaculum rodentium]